MNFTFSFLLDFRPANHHGDTYCDIASSRGLDCTLPILTHNYKRAPSPRPHQLVVMRPIFRLAALFLLVIGSSAPEGTINEDAILRTANDLYMQARAFEDSSQMLTAMRTLTAALRLLPTDARIAKKLRQVQAQAISSVAVPYEGNTLAMPVWIPQILSHPGEPGSADDMVRTPDNQ